MKNLEQLTKRQREKIVHHFRECVRHRMEMWNASDAIEKIIEAEFDSTDDLVGSYAAVLPTPASVKKLKENEILETVYANLAHEYRIVTEDDGEAD